MQAERYRAYAIVDAESRREIDGERQNITHPVEDVIAEGECADGAASFDAGEIVVTKVAFYAGEPDEEVCLGAVDVNAAGEIHVEQPADE
jgi:hypothetical protein